MRISLLNTCAVALFATALLSPLSAADSDASDDRLARMEARLAEMEARLAAAENGPKPVSMQVSESRIIDLEKRLAEAEQETKEAKVMAANSAAGNANAAILGNSASYDILASSAWRNLRWTEEAQWEQVKPGADVELVLEMLGSPPRTVKSAKPRVDEVFYYETSIRDRANSLRGKVSFRHDKVVSVEKPNFAVNQSAQ
jgi:uncharacterized coiled-coil protein SlyX